MYSTGPHGRDDCHDLQSSGATIATILDVGANDGSSALKFHRAFPQATIHSFEPVSSTFAALQRTVDGVPRIRCHQLALGEQAGEATIYLTDYSTTSSIVRPRHVRGEETVRMTTIDGFVAEQSVPGIDLLKVDAEGYDLEVLQGAVGLFDRGAVKFVLIELGFHPDDSRHVSFDHVRDFLLPRGFRVYGFYDQQLEWSGENRLQYANVCFAHRSVAGTRNRATSAR